MKSLVAEPPPLQQTEDGVVRVQGTRVALETVIGAFESGATAEEIALKYPSVSLTDCYAVIAYYLRHRDDVDAYLTDRHRKATEVRAEMESRFPPDGIRERLLARRQGA